MCSSRKAATRFARSITFGLKPESIVKNSSRIVLRHLLVASLDDLRCPVGCKLLHGASVIWGGCSDCIGRGDKIPVCTQVVTRRLVKRSFGHAQGKLWRRRDISRD